jgi:adenylate cyclase
MDFMQLSAPRAPAPRSSPAASPFPNLSSRRERRNAAILFIDVVSFSRIMEADEDAALERWLHIRAELLDRQIEAHRGRIVKGTGDGLLVEFTSAADAARCAVNVQRDVSAANLADISKPALDLRIAIHFAQVVVDDGDIYGDGVNIAARLQEFADPGGILISQDARQQIEAAEGFEFAAVGGLRLKNIRREIVAFRIVDPGRVMRRPRSSPIEAVQPAIAIMPFSGALGLKDTIVVEGVLDEVARVLSGVSDLAILARSTTKALEGGPNTLEQIARNFGVRYVVSGSAARTDDSLLITPKLSDIETGRLVWSDLYRLQHDQLLSAWQTFAQDIVGALAPHLNKAEIHRAFAARPEHLGAYGLVARAAHAMHRLDRENLDEAKLLLDRAALLDPSYGRTFSLLAEWYTFRIGQGLSSGDEDQEKVMAYATAALERDPADGQAMALRGHAFSWLYHEYEEALDMFEAALRIGSSSVLAWTYSSPTFSYVGDWERAVANAQYALRLSPLDPHGYTMRAALALAYYTGRNYVEAARWGRRAVAANPHYHASYRFLIAALAAQEDVAQARRIAERFLRLDPGFRVEPFAAAYAFADSRRNEEFGKHLLKAGLPL